MHLNQEPFKLTRLEYAQYCYDATWTLAYALNKTIKRTRAIEDVSSLRTYTNTYRHFLFIQRLNRI